MVTSSLPIRTDAAVLPIAVPRATTVNSSESPHPLRGRDEAIARLLEVCTRPGTPPIAAVTGSAGAGRTSVLTALRARLAELDVNTVDLRLTRPEHSAVRLVSRFAGELGVRATPGPASLKRLLAGLGPVVVFLDDAQWIAPDCLAELASLARAARDRLTVVCAFRTPTKGIAEPLPRALVHVEALRPLGACAVRRVLADRFQAEPAPHLVAAAREASRGLPAFLHATVDGYLDADSLRLVDRRVRLTDDRLPRPRGTHPLTAGLCELGHPYWPVVKALAVLHPLRGPLPRLISDATGIPENRVLDALRALSEVGVVLPSNGAEKWRFRVPILPSLLASRLGPYERRRLSARAVTALQNDTMSCADRTFLPERLVEAGRLVDAEYAASELLAHGESAQPGEGWLADRWGSAAIWLYEDRARRADALFRHAVLCARHQRFTSAAASAGTALCSYRDQFSSDSAQLLDIVHLVAVASSADTATLRNLVEAVPEDRTVTRATGLCLLDRWSEAHADLARGTWRAADVPASTAALGHVLHDAVSAVLGRDRGCPPPPEAHGSTAAVRRVLVRALTLYGGLDFPSSPASGESSAERAIEASRCGRWDAALNHARDSIATASSCGYSPSHTAMFRMMADIFIAKGQLHRARATIEDARSRPLLLPHLLAASEADLEQALGEHQRARAVLVDALKLAAREEIVAGTDELWLRLLELDWHDGQHAAAGECAAHLERLAHQLGTTRARRNHLLARVLVDHDANAASQAVELTKEHGSPVELAQVLAMLGASDLGGDRMLRTAYGMYGHFDALIPRARLRLLMRHRRITVPGRGTTVSETERLMATLIAEGLTNAQVGTILGTSPKSVECRLTRLFQRTGYRSRAELATAVLDADFHIVLSRHSTSTRTSEFRSRAAA